MKTIATCCISALLLLALPSSAGAQESAGKGASFRFEGLPLRAALDSLMRWFPASIVYLDRDVEEKPVTAACRSCSFEDALDMVLRGSSLTWIRVGNQVILKHAPPRTPPPLHATVCGTIVDSATGAWVPNASVLLEDRAGEPPRQWCPTNSCGFYSLRKVPPGSYTIAVRAIGYRPVRLPLTAATGSPLTLDIALQPEEIAMQEVTVEGTRMPITSAEGFSRGVYIRSTPSDQNQYLLDGARIYNPAHYAGVLSSFNSEALNDIQAAVGGIPSYYGGRIGSILDLSMRDGTLERLSGSLGTGSLGSHLAVEGPLTSLTSFLLSARRGYPKAVIPFLNDQGTPSRLGSAELTAKISHRLSGSSRLFLSGYAGRDTYDNSVEGTGRLLRNDFSWGNSALNLRWVGIVSSSLFLQASAVYTRYGFTLHHVIDDPWPELAESATFSDYAIEDISFRAHAEHYYDQDHTLRGGVEAIHHRMSGRVSAFSTRIAPMVMDSRPVWELAVYLEDQWRLLPGVTAEIGARATTITGPEGTRSAVDPRFSLLFRLNDRTRLYGSLGALNQFLHPYRNSGVFLFYPTVFWYPSGEGVKPSTAFQASLGFERSSADEVYLLSLEPYYRVIQNLHEFRSDRPRLDFEHLGQAMLYGTGRSYGVGLSLRKRTGTLSGSVHYALSWGKDQFPELRGGASFPSRFDRRHEVQAELLYRPSEGWTLGALCVIATNEEPAQAVASASATRDPQFGGADPGKREAAIGASLETLVDLNGNRAPGFQRLELKLQRAFMLWGLPCQLTLSFLNGYGLLDPFSWELHASPDPRNQWTAGLKRISLFPLYPSLAFSATF